MDQAECARNHPHKATYTDKAICQQRERVSVGENHPLQAKPRRSRRFPVEGVDTLISDVTQQQRRIVGRDSKPSP